MYRFTTALCAGIIATVLFGGIAFTPTAAEAATTSSADKAALKETAAACKAEAKEKNIKWPAIASQRLSNSRRPRFRRLLLTRRSLPARRRRRARRSGGPRAGNSSAVVSQMLSRITNLMSPYCAESSIWLVSGGTHPRKLDVCRTSIVRNSEAVAVCRARRPGYGMSALGQKQTFAPQKVMSALPSKADMYGATTHVR
jgi:hypothetical protein